MDAALAGIVNKLVKENNGYIPAEDMDQDLITASSFHGMGGKLFATDGTFG